VADALSVVWAHASDGPSLTAVSDMQLQEWGVEAADVRAEVLARIHHRFHVPIDIVRIILDDNAGLGSTDGGREAMRLLSELLPVLASGQIALDCERCKLGDEGVVALAEVVPQLPHLSYLMATDNACTGAGARVLRRAWQAARKPGLLHDEGHGLWLSSMDVLYRFCSVLRCFCSKTYTTMQRARAWPLEGLPAMAAEGRMETVVELVNKYHANTDAKTDKETGGTALHAAARRGHVETVKALVLTCSAYPNATDKKTGGIALHAAARGGHAATVEVLLQTCGAKPELTGRRGMTALAHACAWGHALVAEKLVAPTHTAGALNVVNTGEIIVVAGVAGRESLIHGVFEPTGDLCNGKPVFRTQTKLADEVWLRFNTNNKWTFRTKNTAGYFKDGCTSVEAGKDHPMQVDKWEMDDTTKTRNFMNCIVHQVR
jgi:ankyrin repeat protein